MSPFKLGKAIYELVTDDTKFNAGLEGAKAQTKSFGLIAAGVAGAGVGVLANAIGGMARAAAEEEVGIKRLGASLQAAGLDYEELGGSIERKIAAQTKSFAFSDGAQRDSLSRLVAVTKDASEAFRLQAIAMDLARFKGIDLVTATEAVVAVAAGRFRALAQMGIEVDKNMTKEEALAKLQATVAGQAQAYGESQKAVVDRVSIAWGNVRESIGGALGPLASGAMIFQGFGLRGIVAAGGIGAMGRALVSTTRGVHLFGLALRLTPLGLVITAATALGFGLKMLYERFEGVRNVVQGLGNVLRTVIPGFGFIADLAGEAAKALGLAGDEAKDMGDDFAKGTGKAVGGIRSLKQTIDELGGLLEPAGAERTKKLLAAIGADEGTISAAIDALADEVGGTLTSKLQKRTDQVYAELTASAEKTILGPIRETLERVTEMSEADFAKLAKTRGQTAKQYMEQIKRELADAERRFEHFSKMVGGAVATAREGTDLDPDVVNRRSIAPHVAHIHQIRDAWREAREAAADYQLMLGIELANIRAAGRGGGTQMLTAFAEGGTVARTGVALVHAGERIIPAEKAAAGALSVALTLNYNAGGGDGTAAQRMASDVLDTVTEGLRQQLRRFAVA